MRREALKGKRREKMEITEMKEGEIKGRGARWRKR